LLATARSWNRSPKSPITKSKIAKETSHPRPSTADRPSSQEKANRTNNVCVCSRLLFFLVLNVHPLFAN
jgi:hypothetical protein